LPDFELFVANSRNAGFRAKTVPQRVEVTTLDDYVARHRIRVDFLKVDIEGKEMEALEGARETLKSMRPVLLIEVSRNHVAVAALLAELGYRVVDDKLRPVLIASGLGNYFCVPRERPLSREKTVGPPPLSALERVSESASQFEPRRAKCAAGVATDRRFRT
jgi:hypothetical protein